MISNKINLIASESITKLLFFEQPDNIFR